MRVFPEIFKLGILIILISISNVGQCSSIISNSSGAVTENEGRTGRPSQTVEFFKNRTRKNGVDEGESSSEEVGRLLDILNATSLRVSELVLPQNETLKARIGHKEFIALIKLVEGVRKFVDDQSTRVSSQDASEDDFGISLKDIQKFFTENEHKLGEAIKQATGDKEDSSSSSGDGDNGSSVSNGSPTDYPILGGNRISERNQTSHREGRGRGGLVNNFMKMSSQMTQGVQDRVRQAGSLFQDSVTQVQEQISRFVNGVGGFIRRISGDTRSVLPEIALQ